MQILDGNLNARRNIGGASKARGNKEVDRLFGAESVGTKRRSGIRSQNTQDFPGFISGP